MGKLQLFFKDKVQKQSLVIYIIAFIMYVIMILCKRNYHIDETLTLGLSNYHSPNTSISMSFEDGKKYIPSNTAYIDYMSVSTDGRFDYKNVWINQEHDVHPPLYYAIVHTVCSFFPGKVSVWFPGVVNIVFMLLTLYVLRKLLVYLCADDMIITYASLFFIFSAGMLSIATFMRMYVMVMFFTAWITYLLLQIVDTQYVPIKGCISIFAVTVMGALTHYYFIVYIVFLCMSIGMYLLIKRQWKPLLQLLLTMIVSGSIAIIIFPSMINHIFFGYRGEDSFKNIENNSILEYWKHLKIYYSFLNDKLMGGLLGYILVMAVFLLLTRWCLKEEKKNIRGNVVRINQCIILGFGLLAYFCMISKIAVYQVDSYISPIYAVTIVFVMSLIALIMNNYHIEECNKKVILSIMLAIALVTSWKGYKWEYLYTDSVELVDKVSNYQDKDCIYIYNEPYRVQANYIEIEKLNSVTFYKDDHYSDMFSSDILNQNEIILYIVKSCNVDSILKDIVAHSPYINKYEQLGSFGYSNSYRLYSENVDIQDINLYSYDERKVLTDAENTNNALTGVVVDGEMLKIVKKPENTFVTIYKDGLVLDNDHNIYKAGNNIQFFTYNNSEAQHWQIVQNQDGTVCIVAVNNKYALTRRPDGNVILDDYNQDDKNQKWWLK